jgi:ribulose-5-phosphate 4-epimerase/fuculose-1-phosphate aldolase
VFCGTSTAEAVVTAIWLERAAEDALLVAGFGIEVSLPSEEELRAKRSKALATTTVAGFWEYLCRRLDAAESRCGV